MLRREVRNWLVSVLVATCLSACQSQPKGPCVLWAPKVVQMRECTMVTQQGQFCAYREELVTACVQRQDQ